jgi:hypothetical protein
VACRTATISDDSVGTTLDTAGGRSEVASVPGLRPEARTAVLVELSPFGLRHYTDLADSSAVHLQDLEHSVLHSDPVARSRVMTERAEQ